MCNTCCNFDEWESCETQLKVQLLFLFLPSISCSPLSLSLPLSFPPLKHPSKLLIQGSSWWWSSFFHGLFLNGWRLLSPLLLCLPLHLPGGKSPLKDPMKLKDPASIEAPQASFHQRRSQLDNGSSRDIQMVITFNSEVRFRRITYRDARNCTTEALEIFKWSWLLTRRSDSGT